MSNTTKVEAIRLMTKALDSGLVVRVRGYGHDITLGPYQMAVVGYEKFSAFNYSSGNRYSEFFACQAEDVARWVVDRVGRGAAGKAARSALLRILPVEPLSCSQLHSEEGA
jgi:hypothetical protein